MLTDAQLIESMRRRDNISDIESKEAKKAYVLYCDLMDFKDTLNNAGGLPSDTFGQLKANTFRGVLSIVHDEFMLAEYGSIPA